MSVPTVVFLGLSALATGLWLLLVQAVFRPRRAAEAASPTERHDLPRLSLIKPIKGIEESLEANLRSFFEQDYPSSWEIVFASTDDGDPGLQLARQLAADYPDVAVRFVRSDPGFGLNPKVANMQGALQVVRYDLVFQTDANVRARPGFLREAVTAFESERASLLGLTVVGTGERSLGAALETLQLSAHIAPLTWATQQLTETVCVIGKALMFRRAELQGLGGLARVRDVLAEDYLLGELYREAGRRVVLSPVTVENVNVGSSVASFVRRHARWLKMRRTISVLGFTFDLFANPLLFAIAAWAASGLDGRMGWALLGLIGLKGTVDNWVVARVRGAPLRARHWWLPPVRDLVMAGVWVDALCSRTTAWRGRRFRLGRGTALAFGPVANRPVRDDLTDGAPSGGSSAPSHAPA